MANKPANDEVEKTDNQMTKMDELAVSSGSPELQPDNQDLG